MNHTQQVFYYALALVLFVTLAETGKSQVYKTIGTPTTNEGAYTFIPSPNNGYFIVGGYHEGEAMIAEIDNSGNVQWNYHFDVKADTIDRILDLKLDSQGKLLGCGTSGDANHEFDGFAFRFDLGNRTLDWVYETITAYNEDIRFFHLHDIPDSSEVLIVGTTRDFSGSDTKTNAGILKLDRATGAEITGSDIQYSNTTANDQDDNFLGSIYIGGKLYVTGRANLGAPSGLSYARPILVQLDIDTTFGNVNQANYYAVDLQSSARLYGKRIIQQNGGQDVAILAHGPYGSTNLNQSELTLIRQSLTAPSTHEYFRIDITGSEYIIATELLETSDGYVLYVSDHSDKNKVYLIRLEEDGAGSYDVTWAKEYSGFTDLSVHLQYSVQNAYLDSSFIYFLADVTINSSNDVLWGKCHLSNGLISGGDTSCSPDITVTVEGPYSEKGSFGYEDPQNPFDNNNPRLTPDSTTFVDSLLCEQPDPPTDSCEIEVTPNIDSEGCTYYFSASITGGSGPFYYHWDFGDGHTSNDPNPTHRYVVLSPPATFHPSLTIYSYYYKSDDEYVCCATEVDLDSIVIAEAYCDPCQTPLSFTVDTLCCGAYLFEAVTADHLTALFWDFGDGNTATGTKVVHQYAGTGSAPYSYTVTLRGMYYADSTCCILSRSAEISFNCEPEGESSEEFKRLIPDETSSEDGTTISIFPNPAKGSITVTHSKLEVTSIQVVNMTGNQVRAAKPDNSDNTQIDVADLPPGMYLVVVKSGKAHYEQFIKL